jgi:hypothetical protein
VHDSDEEFSDMVSIIAPLAKTGNARKAERRRQNLKFMKRYDS